MTAEHTYWKAPLGKALDASISLPGSKSLTNRELVLSAIAMAPSTLISPLKSRDTLLMIQALEGLGTKFEWQGEDLLVIPSELIGPAKVDCGLAGTVMRFLPPLAALAKGETQFDGDLGARKRPMKTTIDSLRELGVNVESETYSLPLSVHGNGFVRGGELEIDASKSSQFVSGLLLVAARFQEGLTLKHIGNELPSAPHIEMTLAVLRNRGVKAKRIDERTWRVEPGLVSGGTVIIEPDLSNAGPFLAAVLVAGGNLRIKNWPANTTQVGDEFRQILPQMGAEVELKDGDLVVSGGGSISGIDIDLSIGGELAPVIAALAALADSPSRITGIAHLRGHETDRLFALCTEINRIGGNATELPDGIEIQPGTLHGAQWQSYEDHRMATAGAVIGLRVKGIEIENIQTTQKTMPDFVALWETMLGIE
jgi:3-phosphoshikimate 1-carboxyvinyltransferase